MNYEFEILNFLDHPNHNRGQFIFARQLDLSQEFEVKEGSLLGGIPIYNYLNMPRMLDENGNPRLDVFVFRPMAVEKLPDDCFKKGQVVTLVLLDR